MKRSKGRQLGTLLITMLLANVLVPVVNAESPVPIDAPNGPVSDGTYISSPSKEIQKLVFDAIEASKLTKAEKKDLIKKLKDIWSGKSKLYNTR